MKNPKATAQITADTLHLMIQGSQTDREIQEDFDDQETYWLRRCLFTNA